MPDSRSRTAFDFTSVISTPANAAAATVTRAYSAVAIPWSSRHELHFFMSPPFDPSRLARTPDCEGSRARIGGPHSPRVRLGTSLEAADQRHEQRNDSRHDEGGQ